MALLSAITGPYVYLDTNLFIYALVAFPDYLADVSALFHAIDQGHFQAVTSELTLAETLVKPVMDSDSARQAEYQRAIQTSRSLQVVSVNRRVLTEAAVIRAQTGLRLPDAIHAATSVLAACETFLTNDPHFRAVPGLPVVILSETL